MRFKYFNNKRVKVFNTTDVSKEYGESKIHYVLYRNLKKGFFQPKWLVRFKGSGFINLNTLIDYNSLIK